MKKFFAVLSLLFSFAVLFSGNAVAGSNTPAPLSTPDLEKTISAHEKNTVIFFLNPYGGPCKAQNEIIQKLLKDRKNSFNVALVSSMNENDRKAFYDYGVRGLPSLVLVDRNGNIDKVFPPGIQSYQTISSALDAVK